MNFFFNSKTMIIIVSPERVDHLPLPHSGFAVSDSGRCGNNGRQVAGCHTLCGVSSAQALVVCNTSQPSWKQEWNEGKFWCYLVTEQQIWRHSSHKDLSRDWHTGVPEAMSILSLLPLCSFEWLLMLTIAWLLHVWSQSCATSVWGWAGGGKWSQVSITSKCTQCLF